MPIYSNLIECGLCISLEDEEKLDAVNRIYSDIRLLYIEKGVCKINYSDFSQTLKNNQLVFLKNKNAKFSLSFISNDTKVFVIDFSNQNLEFSDFLLKTNIIYSLNDSTFNELIENFYTEYTETFILNNEKIFSSFLTLILAKISKNTLSVTIPAEELGINGFSDKDCATRTIGNFKGKHSIKIVPNNFHNNKVVVMENYDITSYNIELREYKYVVLNYYFDSELYQPSATFRVLSVLKNNNKIFYFTNFLTMFAKLEAKKWSSAVFEINLSEHHLQEIENIREPIIKQIKINPFGTRPCSDIYPDEIIYISSVTFYKEIPEKFIHSDVNDLKIKNAIYYIDKHFLENRNLQFYANKCCLSESHFRDSFKSYFGVSPHKLILNKRIEYAQAILLIFKDKSVKNIALEAGFDDPHYFSRIFKKHTGVSPNEYRKKYFINEKTVGLF